MKCLWLTRKLPRPANSGELIYSDGMIRAFARQPGVSLTVIAHDNDEAPAGSGRGRTFHRDEDGAEWRLGGSRLGSRLGSLFSALPADSWRLRSGGPGALLAEALAAETWDAAVVDHAALGWALSPLRKARRSGSGPALVYLSHNHEARVRREVARHAEGSAPRRLALRLDAEKYARQEEALCREADLVTAITESETETYRRLFPGRRHLCLSPGYEGPVHDGRTIDATVPRRAVMSGSFEWIAKRINLERFLEQAASPFAAAGVDLKIVGKAEEGFRAEMQRRFPGVEFTGRVPDMSPHLLDARIGLIVEEFGGGFKLKTLDYIFHGLPLAGLEHSVDGLPLRSPEHILLAPDIATLVARVAECIDDFPRLSRMSQSSLEICRAAFRWEDRGARLLEALHDLTRIPAAPLAGSAPETPVRQGRHDPALPALHS